MRRIDPHRQGGGRRPYCIRNAAQDSTAPHFCQAKNKSLIFQYVPHEGRRGAPKRSTWNNVFFCRECRAFHALPNALGAGAGGDKRPLASPLHGKSLNNRALDHRPRRSYGNRHGLKVSAGDAPIQLDIRIRVNITWTTRIRDTEQPRPATR